MVGQLRFHEGILSLYLSMVDLDPSPLQPVMLRGMKNRSSRGKGNWVGIRDSLMPTFSGPLPPYPAPYPTWLGRYGWEGLGT